MRLIFARMVGKRWVAWVILALGLTFSVLALFLLKARIESEARLRFDNNVMSVSYAIQSRIWSYYDVLYVVQGLFKLADAVTRADFRKYASSLNLRERYPGFQVLSFSRYLQRTELKDYEERVRRDTSLDAAGYPDFKVKPPGDRAEYYVVDYIEPMAGNDNAFGFDLHAEPLRVLALERARDTGEIVASGRLVLVSSRQVGFSLRVPVYRNEMPLRTEKDRRTPLLTSSRRRS
jgi:CHASE1-domain containing sensor protein